MKWKVTLNKKARKNLKMLPPVVSKKYPKVVVTNDTEDNVSVNFRELDWYKETLASMAPSENLKLLREERQLTLKELAKKSGFSITQISDYENGKTKISQATAKKLAEALDTVEENLFW